MNNNKKKIVAILLASGKGERLKNEIPKQFTKLAGFPVILHTLRTFQSSKVIDEIVVVTINEYIEETRGLCQKYNISKAKIVVKGGSTRQRSSEIGINQCSKDTGYVLIHDSVRPFVSHDIINNLINMVKIHKSVDTIIPTADTIVEINNKGFIKSIPNRTNLRRGQTPQAFEFNLIKKAHLNAKNMNIRNATDDCSLVLKLKKKVFTIPGDVQNIKITYPLDLEIADKLFQLKNISTKAKLSNNKNKLLKNKVFIIIGGTSGFGKAISQELKKYDCKIYSLSRNTDPSIDISNLKQIKKVFRDIYKNEGKIDYIINSAGDMLHKNIEDTTDKDWNYIYNINIKGPFNISKGAIPILKKQNGGHLIFIGSSSYTRGRQGYAAYSSSKAALVNFCQALAEELIDFNIKVNILNPARANTPLRNRIFGKEDPKSLLKPEKVAARIYDILFSEITGSVFDIN